MSRGPNATAVERRRFWGRVLSLVESNPEWVDAWASETGCDSDRRRRVRAAEQVARRIHKLSQEPTS